jgi:hypothetical protein
VLQRLDELCHDRKTTAILVRLRTSATKRFKKVENATSLIWKTLLIVEQHFRKMNAPHLCTTVYDGAVYRDGIPHHPPDPKAARRDADYTLIDRSPVRPGEADVLLD